MIETSCPNAAGMICGIVYHASHPQLLLWFRFFQTIDSFQVQTGALNWVLVAWGFCGEFCNGAYLLAGQDACLSTYSGARHFFPQCFGIVCYNVESRFTFEPLKI